MGTVCDEQHFRETETFGATVTMFSSGITSVFSWLISSRFELCVVIKTDVELFLCDNPNNLPLCGGKERVSSLNKEPHQILCRITATQTKDGVMQSITFGNGRCVRQADTRVRHNVRLASRTVEEQDSLERRPRRAAKRRSLRGRHRSQPLRSAPRSTRTRKNLSTE